MNKSNDKKRSFFSALTNSNVFWVILSFLAAVVLWLYVTSTEGVEIETKFSGVKVEYLGEQSMREANGLVITEKDTPTIDVTLSGTRRVLSKLSSSTVTAAVDLTNVTSDGRYAITYDLVYPEGVSSEDVSLVRCSTDVIAFYVDRLTSKTVLMEGSFSGNTAEGYLAEKTLVINPVVVKVSGPKRVINKVERGFVSITRENVDQSLQFSTSYDLLDEEGNIVDDESIVRETEEVSVMLNVLSTKSVPLDVTIIDGGGATRENNTSISIEPASVMLAGDAAMVDSINRILLGTIDLSDFETDYTNTFTIVPPNDVENLTGITEATVTVSINGLATRSFEISDDHISINNLPEDLSGEVITKTLSVIARAPEEVLDQIEAKNIRAVADMKDMELVAGSVYTPYVKVFFDGFPDAGVIGDYKVYISVSAK